LRRRSSRTQAYADWVTQLLANLDRSGPVGHETVSYAQDTGMHVGIRSQSAGARWTPWNRIEMHPRYAEGPADSPYALSLVVHEVRHLRQGWLTALSVYGELDAWQCQFRFLESVTGPHRADADRDRIIPNLMSLPLGWDRAVLRTARDLMQAYAGRNYRVDLLPLYPLHRELLFLLAGRHPTRPA
jgi:hypothetical protein